MKTETPLTPREQRALLSVEKAARRVVRYPGDRAPMQSLSNALRKLNKAREQA